MPITAYAEAFRAARLKAGLSQQALGQRASLTQSYISRVEGGVEFPNVETARRLNALLDIPQAVYANAVLAATAEANGLTFRELGGEIAGAFDAANANPEGPRAFYDADGNLLGTVFDTAEEANAYAENQRRSDAA